MADTDATTMTSLRVSRLRVVEWRSRSSSMLMLASFSMKRSRAGTYASGW